MDTIEDFVRLYLEKAIFQWQASRKWAAKRFGRELKVWLNDVLPRMPDVDWRAEWEDFAEDSRSRGVRVTNATQLLAFLEKREQDLLARRECSVAQSAAIAEPVMAASPMAPGNFRVPAAANDASSRHHALEWLQQMGRDIMRIYPADKWLYYARLDADLLKPPTDVRQEYLDWILSEQTAAIFAEVEAKQAAARSSEESLAFLQADDAARAAAAIADQAARRSSAATGRLPPDWPKLSPDARNRYAAENGLAWWWPVQPTNGPADAVWEMRLQRLAAESRDRLGDVFCALEALGAAAEAADPADDTSAFAFDAHRHRIEAAYDAYMLSQAVLHEEIARYFNSGYSVVGMYVLALIEKISRSLPARIAGLSSKHAGRLTAAIVAAQKASQKALATTETSYNRAVVADWVITSVELLTGIGAITVATRKVAKDALLKGALPEAAKRAAIKFAAKQVAIAVATQGAATAVLPPILESTGLNEHQIRAGLILLQAMAALKMAADAARVMPRTDSSTRESGRRKRQRGNLFNRERAPHYEHNDVYLESPSGVGYVKLDSYNHSSGEIVSRKETQLSEISETTALRYIREIPKKYKPGSLIADVPSNADLSLKATTIEGQMILEVPVQSKRVPKKVLDTATELHVLIRDKVGRKLNQL